MQFTKAAMICLNHCSFDSDVHERIVSHFIDHPELRATQVLFDLCPHIDVRGTSIPSFYFESNSGFCEDAFLASRIRDLCSGPLFLTSDGAVDTFTILHAALCGLPDTAARAVFQRVPISNALRFLERRRLDGLGFHRIHPIANAAFEMLEQDIEDVRSYLGLHHCFLLCLARKLGPQAQSYHLYDERSCEPTYSYPPMSNVPHIDSVTTPSASVEIKSVRGTSVTLINASMRDVFPDQCLSIVANISDTPVSRRGVEIAVDDSSNALRRLIGVPIIEHPNKALIEMLAKIAAKNRSSFGINLISRQIEWLKGILWQKG